MTTELYLNCLGDVWFCPVDHLQAHACPVSTGDGFHMLTDFFNVFLTLEYSIPMNSSFQKVNPVSSTVYDVGHELTGTEISSP